MRVMCRGAYCPRFCCSRELNGSPKAIEGALRDQEGIHSIKVALLAERAAIEYDPSLWNVDKLVNVSASALPVCLILTIFFAKSRKFLMSVSMRHLFHPQKLTSSNSKSMA